MDCWSFEYIGHGEFTLVPSVTMSIWYIAKSFAIKTLLSKVVERYGTVLEFLVDSKGKTIKASLLLLGENDPIHVYIDGYEVNEELDGVYFTPAKLNISREWMSLLAEDLIQGVPFRLPDGIAGKIVKLIL